jgi:hypothetical protein
MDLLPFLWIQSTEQPMFRAAALHSLKILTGVNQSIALTNCRLWENEVLRMKNLWCISLISAQTAPNRSFDYELKFTVG